MSHVQFATEEEQTGDIVPMEEKHIRGIGTIAGIFPIYISAESNLGSLVFTNQGAHGVYTERGLFNMDFERFDIIRTAHETYPTDINSEATERRRTSFVGNEGEEVYPDDALYPGEYTFPGDFTVVPVQGWIPYGVDVLDSEGNIIPENILPAEPLPPDFDEEYYYPYYGDKHLFLAETFLIFSYLDLHIYKQFLECCQRIRRNGPSIEELVIATELLVEDYVVIEELTPSGVIQVLNYHINEESEVDEKVKRLSTWKKFLQDKFKQITTEEVS